MLSFIRLLKSMLMVSNAVAIVTFPPSMLSPSSSTRLQHMADTLLSIKAIPGLSPLIFSFVSRLTSLFLTCALTFFSRWWQGIGEASHWLQGHKWIPQHTQSCAYQYTGINYLIVDVLLTSEPVSSYVKRPFWVTPKLMKSKFLLNKLSRSSYNPKFSVDENGMKLNVEEMDSLWS